MKQFGIVWIDANRDWHSSDLEIDAENEAAEMQNLKLGPEHWKGASDIRGDLDPSQILGYRILLNDDGRVSLLADSLSDTQLLHHDAWFRFREIDRKLQEETEG